jgi:diguanylate cyclase (GGDEF)-like protein
VIDQTDKNLLEEMLKRLKELPALSPYNLTLYRGKRAQGAGAPAFEGCGSVVEDPLCWELSQQFFAQELEGHLRNGAVAVSRYGGGFLGFVVPFELGGCACCLVGDGVRDQSIDLWQVASMSSLGGPRGLALLPHVETLWTTTMPEVEETAQEAARLIATHTMGRPRSQTPHAGEAPASDPVDTEHTDLRLHAVAEALEELDRAKTLAETLALAAEAMISNFRIAGLAVALREADSGGYHVCGLWGLPEELGFFPAEALGVFLSRNRVKKAVPFDHRMRSVLPALQANLGIFFPLESQDDRLGFLAVVDTQLRKGEIMLASMVAHATAARLARIMKDLEQAKETAKSGRLMSLANTLLHLEDKDELYQAVLGMASDLVEASQGSMMLIDKNGKSMQMVSTQGAALSAAHSIPLRVGRGISGKVAQSGEPLLVQDVEKDLRVAIANRARFKTKSLLCVPLKLKEKVIGVLNLADKKNLAPFNDADLQLVCSFANLASLMIERSLVLEESVRFEQLSVTDSLTGLYNRRFLKSRLEEELNRSTRQGLNLTVLFIDLDMFKTFNDVCGHIAGDDALRKTAEIIKSSLREMDIVARYGGEEFCALLPGTPKAEAMTVAERIRREIEAHDFTPHGEIPFRRMTASLGVATFPEDGRTFKTLVHSSDMALYQAKAAGRNCIVAATSQPEEPPIEEAHGTVPTPAPAKETVHLAKTLDFHVYGEASSQRSLD